MESITLLIVELVNRILSGNAEWWVYAIILFIPFSVMIAVREAYCWFNKINKVVSRLERLDKRFKNLNQTLEELVRVLAQNHTVKNDSNRDDNTFMQPEEKFIIEKNWSQEK